MNKIAITQKYLEPLNKRNLSVFLILLLCGDLAFIVVHVINVLGQNVVNPLFNIEEDNSYPELYQYLKFFSTIVLLTYISFKNKTIHYSVWILVFTYLLIDDSLQIHERGGVLIAAHLNFIPPFGLRLLDIGELIVSATIGTILLPTLIWAYQNGSQMFKKTSQDFILLLLILAFFGVFVDMIHAAVNSGWKTGFILGLIEDGGEMIAVSFILWYVFLTVVREDNANCYLCDLVRIDSFR